LKKGLSSLADDLEDTVKGLQDFIKSLAKAQKDLKGVEATEEVKTVSTSSKRVVAPAGGGVAKTKAASTLFSLLSGGPGEVAAAPTAAAASGPPTAAASIPPVPSAGGPPKRAGPPSRTGGPPKAPSAGPPKAPSAGPPKAPSAGGPPKRGDLPPAPKLPPSPDSGPPVAPAGVSKVPSFAKRSGPPTPPGVAAPAAPAAAAKAGGGLSSLRDEMLEELSRLKKIMRGD